jgi:hypothetical protein
MVLIITYYRERGRELKGLNDEEKRETSVKRNGDVY